MSAIQGMSAIGRFHSINILIPIQTLISSYAFIKIPVPIMTIAILILFQKSLLQTWKKLNSFNFFPVSWDYNCRCRYFPWIGKQVFLS